LSAKQFNIDMKKYYDGTPLQLAKQKDVSKLKTKMSWEVIVEDKKEAALLLVGEGNENMKFGIPILQQAKAFEAQTLQNYFGINDEEANLAYEIAEANSLPYEDVFEYVYGYVWKYIEESDKYQNNRDNNIREELTNESVMDLYFNKDLSFSGINTLLVLNETLKGELDFNNMTQKQCNDLIDDTSKRIRNIYKGKLKFIESNRREYGYCPDDFDWCSPVDDFAEANSYNGAEFDFDDPDVVADLCFTSKEDYDEYIEKHYDCMAEYEDDEYVIDLDDEEEYQNLLKEIDSNPSFYRGNKKRRMPDVLNSIKSNSYLKDRIKVILTDFMRLYIMVG